jgi:hypothetical protein
VSISCEKCASAGEATADPGILRDLPFFESLRALQESFPQSSGDNKTHRAAEPLAYYRELPNAAECQFGGHRHNNGYVVRTACGRTYYMGHICGGKHIIGLPAFVKAHEKELRKKSEELSRKEVLRQAPSEAVDKLDRWLPFGEAVDAFVSGRRMHCRPLYDELVARSHKSGRGREVVIRDTQWWRTPKEKRIGRPHDRYVDLAGFEVLNPVIAPRSVRRLRDQVRSFVSTVRVREPALADADALWREWTALKKLVGSTVSKLESARRMFSAENLNLLIIAAREGIGYVPKGIRVEGSFYYVESAPVGLDLQRFPGA